MTNDGGTGGLVEGLASVGDECGRRRCFVSHCSLLALWWNKRLIDDGFIFVFCDLLSSYSWGFLFTT